jgi:hypothetical protein
MCLSGGLNSTNLKEYLHFYRNLYAPFEPEMLEKAHKDYGKLCQIQNSSVGPEAGF